jgi:hypothetical protein
MTNGQGKSAQGKLRNIMRIIIESGLMYSVIAALTFITVIVGSNAAYVTSDMVCVSKKHSNYLEANLKLTFLASDHQEVQIVGIAFDLILVRTANIYSDGSIDASRGTAQNVPLQTFVSPTRVTRSMNPMTEIYVTSSVIKQGADSIKGIEESESESNYVVDLP